PMISDDFTQQTFEARPLQPPIELRTYRLPPSLPHRPRGFRTRHHSPYSRRQSPTIPGLHENPPARALDHFPNHPVDPQHYRPARRHVVEYLVRVRRAEERDVPQRGEASVRRRDNHRHRPLRLWRLEAHVVETAALR